MEFLMDIKTQWIECRHEDGRPRPIKKCNSYRVLWGLEPLPEPANVPPRESDHNKKPQTPGPGSHLHALLSSIGINPKVNCTCHLINDEMDLHGVEYCRKNRDVLLNKMRGTAAKYSWGETLFATWRTLSTGLIWASGVTDPIGGLFDEACRRAERGDPLP